MENSINSKSVSQKLLVNIIELYDKNLNLYLPQLHQLNLKEAFNFIITVALPTFKFRPQGEEQKEEDPRDAVILT